MLSHTPDWRHTITHREPLLSRCKQSLAIRTFCALAEQSVKPNPQLPDIKRENECSNGVDSHTTVMTTNTVLYTVCPSPTQYGARKKYHLDKHRTRHTCFVVFLLFFLKGRVLNTVLKQITLAVHWRFETIESIYADEHSNSKRHGCLCGLALKVELPTPQPILCRPSNHTILIICRMHR